MICVGLNIQHCQIEGEIGRGWSCPLLGVILFWRSCPGCLAVLFWLYYSGCLVLSCLAAFPRSLSWLTRSSWLFCSCCPRVAILAVSLGLSALSSQSCQFHPEFAVLSWFSWPDGPWPVLCVLFLALLFLLKIIYYTYVR